MSQQVTVRAWVPGEGGSALTDDGEVVVLAAECLQGSGFRFLRSGQRVAADIEGGVVVSVRLP